MSYSYVLLQDEDNVQNWYMILREYNEQAVAKAIEMWKESVIAQIINGRASLTLEYIDKMIWRYIENTINWLNEGKILLINRCGGQMFLGDKHIILKEVENYTFPILNNNHMNGLLSPEGEFIPCEYGHHYEIAQGIEDNDNRYITISHDNTGNNSVIFIGNDITDKQKEFLLSNLDRLDSIHIKILKDKKII